MVSKVTKDQEPIPYQALLDENNALKDEIQSLRARLEEPEELQRAIREGDLDALVMPVSEEDLVVFTLNGADQAYRTFMETANEDMVIVDDKFKVTYAGKRLLDKTGYSQEEVIGRPLLQFIGREYKTFVEQRMEERRKGVSDSYESKLISRDGSPYWAIVSAKPLFDNDGNFTGTLAMLTDITGRKRAEEKLRYHANLVDNVSDAIISTDKKLKIQSWNKAAERMYGWQADEVIGLKGSDVLHTAFPEGLNRETITKDIEKGVWGGELIQRTKDGRDITVYAKSMALKDEAGVVIGGVSISSDITESKLAEEALQESEAKYHGLFNSMAEAFELVELVYENGKPVDYIFLDVNPAWERMTGLKKEQVLGRKASEVIGSVESYWPEAMDRALRTGEIVDIENYGVALDKWYSVNMWKFSETACGVTITDITERKQAEEALAFTAEKFEKAYHGNASAMVLTRVKDGLVVDANQAWLDLTGFSRTEVIGKTAAEHGGWKDAAERAAMVEELKAHGNIQNRECACRKKSGEEYMVLLSSQPIMIRGESLLLSSSIDITERRRMEVALRESEEKYRTIVETANEGIWIVDPEAKTNFVNKKMAEMLGYTQEEMIGKSGLDFTDEEGREISRRSMKERERGIDASHEFKLIRKDGTPLWALVNAKSLFDKSGKFIGSMSMLTDITRRREIETRLKETLDNLEEKVKERTEELEKAYKYLKEINIVRKQEIHHRIKNNLQVISSLLDLQAEKFRGKKNIEDLQVLEAFKESQDRVISMALIHEELHKGGKVDTLNISHYIEELANNLLLTYRVCNNGISLDMDIEKDIFFDMDMSVPLGIIINELISNSLKHAFSGRDKGEIQIKLHREKNGEFESEDCNPAYVLMISDNGIGIPEDLDIEDIDSLGLQLVTSLVDQLDGELELKRNSGTEFIIRFTVEER